MKEKRERTCNNLTRVYICTQQLNDTTWHKDCASSCLSLYSLACDAVEGPGLVLDVGIEISPELDEEEGRCGALVVQLLQAALLLREFVVYLPDVDRLEERIRVVRRASYVDEQVPLVLCARKIGELSVENFLFYNKNDRSRLHNEVDQSNYFLSSKDKLKFNRPIG